jgi:hypothetical protein
VVQEPLTDVQLKTRYIIGLYVCMNVASGDFLVVPVVIAVIVLVLM